MTHTQSDTHIHTHTYTRTHTHAWEYADTNRPDKSKHTHTLMDGNRHRCTYKQTQAGADTDIMTLHPRTHHITVDFDGPHISGTDSTHGEEAVLPLARVHCTLIEVEQPTDPPRHTRIDTQQLSCSQDKQSTF